MSVLACEIIIALTRHYDKPFCLITSCRVEALRNLINYAATAEIAD